MRLYYSSIFLLLLTSLNYASGHTNGVCLSKGGRFPPYSIQGNPPAKVSKGPKDLILCRMYRKKTCCDVAQTHPALISIRKLASTGEASEDCLQLWELLECSICDPQVGVQPGPPLLCASLCDRVYDACSNAYFSMDAKTQPLVFPDLPQELTSTGRFGTSMSPLRPRSLLKRISDIHSVDLHIWVVPPEYTEHSISVLAPCGVNDFVCGRASEWISNGTELCRAAGFAVKPLDDVQGTSCYGGKASLDAIADTWKSSHFNVKQNIGVVDDFKQWLRETSFNEKVSWAVAGMVLTAGLLFTSRKKRHRQHHIQAAIQRNARIRKLDIKKSPTSPVDQSNRRGR